MDMCIRKQSDRKSRRQHTMPQHVRAAIQQAPAYCLKCLNPTSYNPRPYVYCFSLQQRRISVRPVHRQTPCDTSHSSDLERK